MLIVGILAAAVTFTVLPDESPVTFKAVGKPGFLKIDGEGGKLTGTATVDGDRVVSGDFKVSLDAFKTGIDLRDDHMKNKYLSTPAYPTADLMLDPMPLNGKAFKGVLKLKGNMRPIKGDATISEAGSVMVGTATFQVKLSEYPEIGVPSYLGVTVADTVDVSVKFKAKK